MLPFGKLIAQVDSASGSLTVKLCRELRSSVIDGGTRLHLLFAHSREGEKNHGLPACIQ